MVTRYAVVDPVPLRHGYTSSDLDVLTREAARWSPWKFLPFCERADIARFAIAEHILAADDRPDFWPLVFVGKSAIARHVDAECRQRGMYFSSSKTGTPITRYFSYWHGSSRLYRSSRQDRVVDRVALQQIWPKLTKAQQATLLAIAKYGGDFDQAAAELGTTRQALVAQLFAARKRFLVWWHQHERPSHIWGHNVRRDPSKRRQYRGVATGIFRGRERRAGRTTRRDTARARPATSP